MFEFIGNVLRFLAKCLINIIKFVLLLIVIIMAWDYLKEDKQEWIGFVYPDKNNLWNDKNIGTFDSLEACRNEARSALYQMNATYSGDYECALNCDTSRGKPYICEETKR